MPTIANLPAASAIQPTDTVAIDQASGTNCVAVAVLLDGLQPAITTPTGTILGRVSLGSGTPETVSLGPGLVMNGGTLGVGGTISGLLTGETVDQLQLAGPAGDTDSMAVDQGGSSLVRQSLSSIWTYIAGKLPLYQKRIVELTANTVLDATAHNQAIVVCSQPLTLTASFINMGSGFSCDVLNLSSGSVLLGQGITVGNGNTTLPQNASVKLVAFTYSQGSVVFCSGAAPAASSTANSGGTSGSTTSSGSTAGNGQTGSGSGSGSGSSSGSGSAAVSIAFVTAPTGVYAPAQNNIGVNATLTNAAAGVSLKFGVSTSSTLAPTSWTASTLVNTQSDGATFWGAYITAPANAGTYFCWAESSDASASAVSSSFTVS